MKILPARHLSAGVILLLAMATAVAAHPGMQKSLARINALLDSYPEQPALYIKRAAAYRHLQRWELALSDLRRAEALGEPVDAAWDLGMVFFETAEYHTAISCFTRFLERYPKHTASIEYRARAALAAGNYEAAREDFQRYFRLAQHADPGDYLLAAHMLSERLDANSALELLDQGMRQLGLIPQLQRYAVTLDLRKNNLKSALRRWQALEQVLGASPEWKVEKARLLLLANETQRAQALLQEASAQLAELRPTPSRLQLQNRISQMSS
ncbi:MAG: tetratricopeptide repeat protein [Gammaproteobacteria bacterium]|nr:tetratricopeptide repeat protein [Gammaproteobacteria bacterium]